MLELWISQWWRRDLQGQLIFTRRGFLEGLPMVMAGHMHRQLFLDVNSRTGMADVIDTWCWGFWILKFKVQKSRLAVTAPIDNLVFRGLSIIAPLKPACHLYRSLLWIPSYIFEYVFILVTLPNLSCIYGRWFSSL